MDADARKKLCQLRIVLAPKETALATATAQNASSTTRKRTKCLTVQDNRNGFSRKVLK